MLSMLYIFLFSFLTLEKSNLFVEKVVYTTCCAQCSIEKILETKYLLWWNVFLCLETWLSFGFCFSSVKIQDIQLFSDHLVVYERENGLPKVTFYRLPAVGEPLGSLQGGRTVDFLDPIYSVDPSESQFSSSILRFSYSSLRTPDSVYDYDMNTGVSVLKKIQTVSYLIDYVINYVLICLFSSFFTLIGPFHEHVFLLLSMNFSSYLFVAMLIQCPGFF